MLIRFIAICLVGMLLGGAACMPVHSDRPVGVAALDLTKGSPYGVAWGGTWCFRDRPESHPCWTVTATDQPGGVLFVNRRNEQGADSETATLYVRESPEPTLLFLSEEDSTLKGTFLWALAFPYDDDLLLVWFTHPKRDAFEDLVRSGALPGRVVEQRRGHSSVWGVNVEQTVILEGLAEQHLKLIIERRGELFDLIPVVMERRAPDGPGPDDEPKPL